MGIQTPRQLANTKSNRPCGASLAPGLAASRVPRRPVTRVPRRRAPRRYRELLATCGPHVERAQRRALTVVEGLPKPGGSAAGGDDVDDAVSDLGEVAAVMESMRGLCEKPPPLSIRHAPRDVERVKAALDAKATRLRELLEEGEAAGAGYEV